jgi:hypothetical protein
MPNAVQSHPRLKAKLLLCGHLDDLLTRNLKSASCIQLTTLSARAVARMMLSAIGNFSSQLKRKSIPET